MAVLVRSPQHYVGLIEHALRRAKVPAWFSRGTRRPLTAGRAFLALLACASEQLSASRFAEYLSFAQVPLESEKEEATWAASHDEAFGRVQPPAEDDDASRRPTPRTPRSRIPNPESESILAGTLRAPWRWEALIVDAAVIGRDATRWRRRLEGKHAELERQIREAKREDGGDEARIAGLRQVQQQLEYLKAFALPIIEEMAAWPSSATWGEWLDRFEALAPRVLKSPAHVLRVLADLRPMGDVGPDRSGRGATRAGRAAADDGVGATDVSVRARVRRDAGAGAGADVFAWCSFPVWPSGCSRRSRARIR